VGAGVSDTVPVSLKEAAAEGEAPPLSVADTDAEPLRDAAAEALAVGDGRPEALVASEAVGERLAPEDADSEGDCRADREGHDAVPLRLGEPEDEGDPRMEPERGGEREAEGDALSAAEADATLADAEADPAALALARALRESDGLPVTGAVPVTRATVPVTVTDLDAQGDAE